MAKVPLSLMSCKCQVTKSGSQRNVDWANPAFYDALYSLANYAEPNDNSSIAVQLYDLYTGRVELETVFEREYKKDDETQYVETRTDYQYNTSNYQVRHITTTQSNGDRNEKDITYSADLTGGVFDVLRQKNILSLPGTTTSYAYTGRSSNGVIQKTTTKYTTLTSGDIKRSGIFEERYSAPGTFVSGLETQTFTYDNASGNLTGLKDEGNHIVTNIYGYADKYVVASVINADPLLDKPAYSSFETNSLNNWESTGTPSYTSTTAVTGTTSFNLSASNSLRKTMLNTSKPYKISFCATNSGVVVNGNASLVKSVPLIGSFTYYEYDIAQGTSVVSLTGTSTIDELRLYPETARMRTVTYDPLIGKTSECDENNRITYYEYDEMGRLRFIKDEKKHTVKMYEYNTVLKQNGCPGNYKSRAIFEIFTRNNCGAGYLAGKVTYTVPADKYTSLISQADADRKAEEEINKLGQAYANNPANGAGCTQLFYNAGRTVNFETEGCVPGTKGGTVAYTVPANRYSATSQVDANKLEDDEIQANGQANANLPQNRVCTTTTEAQWEADDPVQLRCGTGSMAGHQEAYLKDVNPNSPTYNTWAWKDMGVNQTACPAPVMLNMTYYNMSPDNATLQLKNTLTGTVYTYYLVAGQTNMITLSPQFPSGTYDVTFTPMGSTGVLRFNGKSKLSGSNWYLYGESINGTYSPVAAITLQ